MIRIETGTQNKASTGSQVGKAKTRELKAKLARKKEELKWETNEKATMAKWLSGGINRRADREENPDRDKT